MMSGHDVAILQLQIVQCYFSSFWCKSDTLIFAFMHNNNNNNNSSSCSSSSSSSSSSVEA